jgi:VWFA-related protein
MCTARTSATLLMLLAGIGAMGQALTAEEPPREVGLTERSESRLAQLDITVIGPPEIVCRLTGDDFTIKINAREIDSFQLDRLCAAPFEKEEPEAAAAPLAPASYLFYFDQPHLTMAGRQRSLDSARQLITGLLADGTRAMIASNAGRLTVIEPFTTDPARLLSALDRLEQDRGQWDFYAEQEALRISEVVRTLNDLDDIQRAVGLARVYQKEERWRTDRNLRRLEMTLGQLVDVDPPKAVIYFADTMRANAGEHYLSFFGSTVRDSQATLDLMSTDGYVGNLPFDSVVNQAAAQGIRFYTVQAQGLVNQFNHDLLRAAALNQTLTVPAGSRVRIGDAQQTLVNLASETGGDAFLNGVRESKIIERIRSDSSCIYLASFDPTEFKQDSPLSVSVKSGRPEVELRVRGRLIVQSDSARLTSRLLHAFGSAGSIPDPLSVRLGLMPIDFSDGQYSALLQIAMPGTPLQEGAWDLGASLVSREKVREKIAGRIDVSTPGTPVVLEQELQLKPGSYEISSVAHETISGLIASGRLNIDWPAPEGSGAAIGRVALLQPVPGVFSRDGENRLSGSLLLPPSEPASIGSPIALISLICRDRRHEGSFIIERSLTGNTAQDFPPLTIELDENRCAQVRDLLPADSLQPGYYLYELRLLRDERILQEQAREFFAR